MMQPEKSCRFSRAGFARIYHAKDFGSLIRFNLRSAPPPDLFRGFIGSSHQTLWFCEIRRTKALRGIEDAKSRTKWISDHRAFPNCDVERGHKYLAPPCCIRP